MHWRKTKKQRQMNQFSAVCDATRAIIGYICMYKTWRNWLSKLNSFKFSTQCLYIVNIDTACAVVNCVKLNASISFFFQVHDYLCLYKLLIKYETKKIENNTQKKNKSNEIKRNVYKLCEIPFLGVTNENGSGIK